jgi:signal transduction histidine kinase
MAAAAVRAAEVEAYVALGQAPRPRLVALAELAALLCGTPAAAVTLCDGTGARPIATYGATGDSDRVRFSAAAQLVSPAGDPIGTLSVSDDWPRELTEEQCRGLRMLADRAVDALDLELRDRQLAAAEERLAATQDELRRSHEHLSVLGGQVSHDLRNPLTSVSMSLQMLGEQPSVATDEDARWMLDRAQSGAARLDGLIDELQSYTEAGGPLEPTEVDLAELLDEVRAELTLDGVDLRVGPLPVVYGDPARLRDLFGRLVDNAVDLSRSAATPQVTVRGASTDDGWLLEVCDNGAGVPTEGREGAFDLTACRRVLWAHGGTVALDKSPAGGARVRVGLPDPRR